MGEFAEFQEFPERRDVSLVGGAADNPFPFHAAILARAVTLPSRPFGVVLRQADRHCLVDEAAKIGFQRSVAMESRERRQPAQQPAEHDLEDGIADEAASVLEAGLRKKLDRQRTLRQWERGTFFKGDALGRATHQVIRGIVDNTCFAGN